MSVVHWWLLRWTGSVSILALGDAGRWKSSTNINREYDTPSLDKQKWLCMKTMYISHRGCIMHYNFNFLFRRSHGKKICLKSVLQSHMSTNFKNWKSDVKNWNNITIEKWHSTGMNIRLLCDALLARNNELYVLMHCDP